MICPRCNSDMDLKKQIDFPRGPAKLVYECMLGHVVVTDAPEQLASP